MPYKLKVKSLISLLLSVLLAMTLLPATAFAEQAAVSSVYGYVGYSSIFLNLALGTFSETVGDVTNTGNWTLTGGKTINSIQRQSDTSVNITLSSIIEPEDAFTLEANSEVFAEGVEPFTAIIVVIHAPTPVEGTATATAGTKDITVTVTSGVFSIKGQVENENNWILGGTSAEDNPIVSVTWVDAYKATVTLTDNINVTDDYTIQITQGLLPNMVTAPFENPLQVDIKGGTAADVCAIGEVGYATLEEALGDVKNDETITLLQSISYYEPIVIDGKAITFGLGGFNLNIDASATANSTGLTAINSGKVSCSGSGKLNVEGSKEGVRAEDESEIHVSGSVTAGQYGVYTASTGPGNPKVTVDGDVTVTGQGASGKVEAVSAGGCATVEIGGHVRANRTADNQNVTAVYSNGSTVTVGKDVTTKGSGVNVQNGGEVTIDGALIFDPTGASQSYIKLGIEAAGVKTADDFEETSTIPGYKEYKNGNNIVWIKDAGTTYSVTVNGSYASSTGAGSYAEGATVTINAGNRTGYTFTGWTSSDVTITNAGNKAAGFTMPAEDVTVTANWSYKGGGSSGSPKPPKPTYNADVKEGTGSETTLPVTVNKNKGTASTDTGSGKLSSGETIVTMPSITGVETYSIGIPVPDLSTSEVQGTLALHTDNGIITVPSNMLTGVPGISGSKAQISIGQGDKTTLPEDVKAAIGNRPLVRLALSIDGKQTNWSNPGAPVTVSIPYTPTAAELANPESIVVWYIAGGGNAVTVPSGRYDPATGLVTFTITHFSNYAVVYATKTFDDLASAEWARKPIEVLASKGILRGISETEYAPGTNITRADFLCFLIRALGVDAKFHGNFDDIDNGAYYYRETGSKKLGITGSTGTTSSILMKASWRDMMVLTERALRMLNRQGPGYGRTLTCLATGSL